MNTEEGIMFESSGSFYNPDMRLCRSFFSLAVGAIKDKLSILDSFSASGIRGIRYKKENFNIDSISFLDYSENASKLIKSNIQTNKIKGKVIRSEFSKFLFETDQRFNFIEIDPFGTPIPYLYDAFRFLSKQKLSHLSVTATDVRVLCGPDQKACMKNYHSKSLNNEFTHETGLRILLKSISEKASEFNLAITPLVSLSHRHYIKVLVRVERNAKLCDQTMEKLGYINYCQHCLNRGSGVSLFICNCGNSYQNAGPLWCGEIHDLDFLKNMQNLNSQRTYSDKSAIEKLILLMKGEIDMPPFYYNSHFLAKKHVLSSTPSLDFILEKVGGVRTHFNNLGFKTKKSFNEVECVLSQYLFKSEK